MHARVHNLDQRRSDKAIDHLAFFNSLGGNSGSQGPLVNILTGIHSILTLVHFYIFHSRILPGMETVAPIIRTQDSLSDDCLCSYSSI